MLPSAPDRPRRLVYLGTPEMSVPPLRALHRAGLDIALVVTNPDRRRGRGSGATPSPVKAAAAELGLEVSHRLDDALDVGAELGVVVAFGQIIPARILTRLPMVNLHFSLLPRWRGAAPVERALLAGDERTGVDLMVVEEGLDTGGVYRRAEVPIGRDETAEELRRRLVEAGTELLVEALTEGLGTPSPQTGEPTYAAKLSAQDREIDWSEPAEAVHRLVRVGGAWTTLGGERLKIWRTSLEPDPAMPVPCGDGVVGLVEVQPAGKPRMDAGAWLHGAAWSPGEPLGT